MYLQSYDFNIIDRPGKDNVLADTLLTVYMEREASAEMTLVDPNEKKNIKGAYSAMTSNTRHNLYLAHTLHPVAEQSFFSTTPLKTFFVPQHLSIWNTEDVPIPDSPQDNENNNHPGPIAQELVQMAATLEQGIEAMQSGQASIQGEPIDPSEAMILIQAAQSQLAALASRIHSPSRHMESALCHNAITNCFGRILDAITKRESIALASSGYETALSSASSRPSPDDFERFLMSTEHRAKHWTACVWDECESHMEGKDCHYYSSGPCHIPAPCPLYLPSESCFIPPHHPKRRFEDRSAIPSTLTGHDGHPVFHTIINRSDGPVSNHISTDEDLPVPDASVNYDDPFPDQPSRALDACAFPLTLHLTGKWYHTLRKATATYLLFDIVSNNCNHPSWILIDGLLLNIGEDDSRDCPNVPYEAA